MNAQEARKRVEEAQLIGVKSAIEKAVRCKSFSAFYCLTITDDLQAIKEYLRKQKFDFEYDVANSSLYIRW